VSPDEFEEYDEGGVRIVAFRGELDLDSAPWLCVRLRGARVNGVRGVVLDLSEMSFCDSQGLRALIGEQREMRAAGRRFAVVAPANEQVERILDITGVREMLPLYADRQEALSGVTGG
jgi:anti-sigma B factor antagonist